jgi:GTP pyrophosphokinase
LDLISPPEEKEAPGLVKQVIERIRGSKGIKVSGLDDMMFRFAGCCQPVPGEDIVGFISRGRGVTIHSHDCDRIHYLHEKFPERQIDVNWDAGSGHAFVVELEITVEDRKGMLRDLTQAISDSDTNVKGAEMFARDAAAVGRFVVEVTDLSHLNRIIDKVRKVKGVISAVRAKGKKTD